MSSLLVPRLAIALVWTYQGLWCKLLGGTPRHREILETSPLLSPGQARGALLALGTLECFLAGWVLSGRWAFEAAIAQTVVLFAMNAGGVLWARRLISDPPGMVLQNIIFLLLAWVAAGVKIFDARHG